jgi:hypothetical protein
MFQRPWSDLRSPPLSGPPAALAQDRVEGEAGPDFGDAGRALGDDEEIDRHQDEKDDDADEEVAAHHEPGEAADDVARRGRPLGATREDEPGGRRRRGSCGAGRRVRGQACLPRAFLTPKIPGCAEP